MDHISEIAPQRMVRAMGNGVVPAKDVLPDHQRDLIGMLAYKVLRIEKWTSERAAHREHLERLAEAHGYVGAWLDYRDYHLTIVGQSYQYDVPLGKRGILAKFAGRRVRLVCVYSGPFRRWVRIGVPSKVWTYSGDPSSC